MQVKAGGNLDFAGIAHSKAGEQSTRQIERGGSGREVGDLEQQIAHAFIAQCNTGIHATEINRQRGNARCTNGTANTGEVMHFNIVGVFCGDKIQVGRAAIQIPGHCVDRRRAGIAARAGRN